MNAVNSSNEQEHARRLEEVFQIFLHAQEDWAMERRSSVLNCDMENVAQQPLRAQ